MTNTEKIELRAAQKRVMDTVKQIIQKEVDQVEYIEIIGVTGVVHKITKPKREKPNHPNYFLMGENVYHWETGVKYGTLTQFAENTKGKEWVANSGNTAWFRYDRENGENHLIVVKTGVRS